jgi:type I restriction enzyme S subunit
MAKLIDITGKALSGEWGMDDENGNGIPVIRTTNFTNDGVVNYDNVVTRIIKKKNIEDKYLSNGDIIIEKSGGSDTQPVGRVVYFDGMEKKYLFNNFTGLLRVKDTGRWFPKYVFYSLLFNYKKGGTRNFENKTTGLHNLKLDDYVSKYEIIEIDIENQRNICEKLDKLYFVIQKRKKEVALLDELVRARFVEMFGTLGTDEKGWGLTRLGKCCEINPKKNADKRLTSGIKVSFVPMQSVSEDGKIDTSQVKIYDEVKSGFTYFAENDVLFAKITPCMENGKGAVAAKLYNGIGFGSTEFHVLRPRNEICNAYWLYVLTTFKSFRNNAEMNMTGSAGQKRVPPAFLENHKIALPPIELQNQFADFVAEVDKSKVAVQKALDETRILFDSLMQKYFG